MNKYQELKNSFEELDSSLSFTMITTLLVVIYGIMSNIYLITFLTDIQPLKYMLKIMSYATLSLILQLVLSCLICGTVHHKSAHISDVLNNIETRVLSDLEYRDWQTFHTICQKTSFGFTIGGFASLRKTTLIAVIIICNSNNYEIEFIYRSRHLFSTIL